MTLYQDYVTVNFGVGLDYNGAQATWLDIQTMAGDSIDDSGGMRRKFVYELPEFLPSRISGEKTWLSPDLTKFSILVYCNKVNS